MEERSEPVNSPSALSSKCLCGHMFVQCYVTRSARPQFFKGYLRRRPLDSINIVSTAIDGTNNDAEGNITVIVAVFTVTDGHLNPRLWCRDHE